MNSQRSVIPFLVKSARSPKKDQIRKLGLRISAELNYWTSKRCLLSITFLNYANLKAILNKIKFKHKLEGNRNPNLHRSKKNRTKERWKVTMRIEKGVNLSLSSRSNVCAKSWLRSLQILEKWLIDCNLQSATDMPVRIEKDISNWRTEQRRTEPRSREYWKKRNTEMEEERGKVRIVRWGAVNTREEREWAQKKGLELREFSFTYARAPAIWNFKKKILKILGVIPKSWAGKA